MRQGRHWFRRWVFLCSAAALVIGCRSAESPVVKKRNTGIIYDTAYERILDSEKSLPLLEQAWRADVPLYAEPAAICGWRDGVSTWEVFFATNREADGESDLRHRFGTNLRDAPLYGQAHVTLPRRRRGVDPAPERPDSGKKSNTNAVRMDVVKQVYADSFWSGVAAQVNRSRQRDVLVFVHGFNVDFDSALVRTAQVALDMPFNGAVVAYSWPSKGGMKNYGEDEGRNAQSVAPFQEFLTGLRENLDDDVKIHIVVHSMGNRMVLRALSQMPEPDDAPLIDNLVLCAPDVGVGEFQEWGPAVVARCRRVTLYASRYDAALVASKSLHAEQRAGDADPPVIQEGMETIDCSDIDVTSFLGHSYYGSNVDVLADLFDLIKRDRPADQRSHLASKSVPGGKYWQWTSNAQRDQWTWHFDHLATAGQPQRN